MRALCMHRDYDHLYIPLTSKLGKFQPQTNIFLGNNNPFSIKLTVAWVRFLKKKHQFFPFEISLPQARKKKLILSLEKYFKILKDMIIGTPDK